MVRWHAILFPRYFATAVVDGYNCKVDTKDSEWKEGGGCYGKQRTISPLGLAESNKR